MKTSKQGGRNIGEFHILDYCVFYALGLRVPSFVKLICQGTFFLSVFFLNLRLSWLLRYAFKVSSLNLLILAFLYILFIRKKSSIDAWMKMLEEKVTTGDTANRRGLASTGNDDPF